MATPIYEEADITAEAVLEVGYTGGEVKFSFFQGGALLTPPSKTINVGADQAGKGVSQVCKPPLVPDAEENYLFKAHIDVDAKRLFNEEFEVWPRHATVEAIDEGGKPLDDFRFRVVQGGKPSGAWFHTEVGGTSAPFDLEKAPFSIVAEPPFEILEQPVTKGRKRKIKAHKVPYTIELVKPATGGRTAVNLVSNNLAEGIRQYVNITSVDGRDGNGSKINFQVRIKEVPQRGLDGQVAYVRVQHKKDAKLPNKIRRTAPVPKLADTTPGYALSGTDADGLGTYTAKLPLDGSGEATFTVDLGKTGGDWCEVKVGSTDACGDATLLFQNWRQIDYEIRAASEMLPYMTTPGPGAEPFDVPAATRTALTEIFASFYTELTLKRAHLATPAPAPSLTAHVGDGFLLPKAFLKPSDTSGDKLHCLVRNWNGTGIITAWGGFERARADTTVTIWFCHVLTFGPGPTLTLEKETQTDTIELALPGDKTWLPVKDVIESIEWEAVVRPQDLSSGPATLEFDESGLTPGANGASQRTFRLTAGGASDDLVFTQPTLSHISTTVTDGMKAQILTLLQGATTPARLRADDNEVVVKIVGENGNARRRTRLANVKQAVSDVFATLAPTLAPHPGVQGGVRRKGKLTLANVDLTASDVTKVVVKLPKLLQNSPGKWVGAPGDATCPVKVKLKLVTSGLTGPCAYNNMPYIWLVPYHPFKHVLVARDILAMLLAHEIGHKMKMSLRDRAGTDIAPGLPDAAKVADNEARYPHKGAKGHVYNGAGHNGPHCAYGLSDSQKAVPTYLGAAGFAPECLMFGGETSAGAVTALCPQCIDYLCAHDLESVVNT